MTQPTTKEILQAAREGREVHRTVPEGFKLVPVEPTYEVLRALIYPHLERDQFEHGVVAPSFTYANVADAWKNALAASPSPASAVRPLVHEDGGMIVHWPERAASASIEALRKRVKDLEHELEQATPPTIPAPAFGPKEAAWIATELTKARAELTALEGAASAEGEKSYMFDYIVNGGDDLAKALATIEHLSGLLGTALEENEKAAARIAALEGALRESDVLNVKIFDEHMQLPPRVADLLNEMQRVTRATLTPAQSPSGEK